ncbi:hypothetical protein GN244_ATG17879 [Phytophthora infestans]|uniref:Uncharacterized protein n=1 Tax=Phytophthora infestans TaxID=4787 RepID=A0A833SMH7_PHYIN|nr:hypothetical protein GN244_ATG17879 [Phytophthora infestans]
MQDDLASQGLFRSRAADPYAFNPGRGDQSDPLPIPAQASQQQGGPSNDAQHRYDRIVKAFSIEPFDGSSLTGAVDAGAAIWLQRFEALVATHEDLAGVQLPDNIKNALFFKKLKGTASQWYIANIVDLRRGSFAETGRRLKTEFGSKLPKQEVLIKVASERKRYSETYHEFSLRLRSMAASTTADGLKTVESNNFALSAFISSAWPRQVDSLRLVINEDNPEPLTEMNHAIAKLCTISRSHGAAAIRPISGAGTSTTGLNQNRRQHHQDNRGMQRKRSEPGDVIKKAPRLREQKRARREPRDYSKARCDECGELGHTTGYHNKHVSQHRGLAHAAKLTRNGDEDERKDDKGDYRQHEDQDISE